MCLGLPEVKSILETLFERMSDAPALLARWVKALLARLSLCVQRLFAQRWLLIITLLC